MGHRKLREDYLEKQPVWKLPNQELQHKVMITKCVQEVTQRNVLEKRKIIDLIAQLATWNKLPR